MHTLYMSEWLLETEKVREKYDIGIDIYLCMHKCMVMLQCLLRKKV